MTWNEIFEFMTVRGSEFSKRAVGVRREMIAKVEAGHDVILPQLYVDFLMSVGENSDRYKPFGGGHDTNFRELVRFLPTDRYPVREYWQVSRHITEGIVTREDVFLDLGREAGDDTPLVTISLNYSDVLNSVYFQHVRR